MYELRQVGEKTYFIDCPTRIGIYKLSDTEVCLMDGGSGKSTGRMVQKLLDAQGWTLRQIFNTHSHADHVGGNALLQDRTGCAIYAPDTELGFVRRPDLEPSFVFGGYAHKALRNKFMQAQPSDCQLLTEDVLPAGLRMVRLDGHAGSMCAFCTSDDVWFVADAVISEETLDKYHISYTYNVAGYLQSLDVLDTLEGALFIPSHAEPTEDIRPLSQLNRQKSLEVADFLLSVCQTPQLQDDILKAVFDHYELSMNFTQHALIGSTIRSYLAYLTDEKRMAPHILDNRLYWQSL